MPTQDEIDAAVLKAKFELSEEQFIKTLKQCSYGGEPVNMVHTGGYVNKDSTAVASLRDYCPAEIFPPEKDRQFQECINRLMKGGEEIGKTNRSPTGED